MRVQARHQRKNLQKAHLHAILRHIIEDPLQFYHAAHELCCSQTKKLRPFPTNFDRDRRSYETCYCFIFHNIEFTQHCIEIHQAVFELCN